jgi:hypothetical protein
MSSYLYQHQRQQLNHYVSGTQLDIINNGFGPSMCGDLPIIRLLSSSNIGLYTCHALLAGRRMLHSFRY